MITKQTAQQNSIKIIDSQRGLQKELPEIKIKYQTRINGQALSDVLEECKKVL